MFCKYAFASVAFCYLYQMTFFAGFLAILGEAEKQQRHCLFFYKVDVVGKPRKTNAVCAAEPEKLAPSPAFVQSIYVDTQRAAAQLHSAPANLTHRFFSTRYGPLLLSDGFRFLAVLGFVFYIVLAVFGCMQFKEGLEPKNLVTASHYISDYFRDLKLFWKVGPQLHVAVLRPPNLTDPIQR